LRDKSRVQQKVINYDLIYNLLFNNELK
jgi:hypothetical protein